MDAQHDAPRAPRSHPGSATDEVYREGQAVEVARAWGFEPVGPSLIWSKPNFGMGCFPRPSHEPLLVCRRGKGVTFSLNNVASVQNWNQSRAPRNGGKRHSAKPEAALDLIERASPGPYVELFARRQRFGWDYWGNEVDSTVSLSTEAAKPADPRPRNGEHVCPATTESSSSASAS